MRGSPGRVRHGRYDASEKRVSVLKFPFNASRTRARRKHYSHGLRDHLDTHTELAAGTDVQHYFVLKISARSENES